MTARSITLPILVFAMHSMSINASSVGQLNLLFALDTSNKELGELLAAFFFLGCAEKCKGCLRFVTFFELDPAAAGFVSSNVVNGVETLLFTNVSSDGAGSYPITCSSNMSIWKL
jgi:hypothetical protein